MNIFISQGMGGKSDAEITLERLKVLEELKYNYDLNGEDIQIIDTLFDFGNASPLYYLAKSIEALCQADLVFFVNDWENYRGCRIEYECCKEYGIPHDFLTVK